MSGRGRPCPRRRRRRRRGTYLLCASAMAHALFSASRLEKKYGSTVSEGTIDQSASVKRCPTPRSMGLQQQQVGGGMRDTEIGPRRKLLPPGVWSMRPRLPMKETGEASPRSTHPHMTPPTFRTPLHMMT